MTFKEIMTHPATGIIFATVMLYLSTKEKKWKSARLAAGGGLLGISVYRLLESGKCEANRVRAFSIDASTGRPCDDRSVHCL